jgi:hypothetical protein
MSDITQNINQNINIDAKDKASEKLKKIGSNIKDVDKEIKKVNKDTKEYSKTQVGLSNSTNQIATNMSSMVKGFAKAGVAIFAAYKSLQLLSKKMDESINLATVQINAEQELASTLGFTSNALKQYASELQNSSTYGDEAILSAMSQTAAFIKEEDEIKKIQKASLNLAAAKKMDLRAATNLVTKSIITEGNALKEYGIDIDNTLRGTERMTALLKGLDEAFGGVAKSMAMTDVGHITQMKNSIGDLKEEIGFQLIPFTEDFYSLILKISTIALPSVSKGLNSFKDFYDTILGRSTKALNATERAIRRFSKLPVDDRFEALNMNLEAAKTKLKNLTLEQEKISSSFRTGLGMKYYNEIKTAVGETTKKIKIYENALNDLITAENKRIDIQERAAAKRKAEEDAKALEKEKERLKKAEEERMKILQARWSFYMSRIEGMSSKEQETIDKQKEENKKFLDYLVTNYEKSEQDREKILKDAKAKYLDISRTEQQKLQDIESERLFSYKMLLQDEYITETEYNALRLEAAKETNQKLSELDQQEKEAIAQKFNLYTQLAMTAMSYISNINSMLSSEALEDITKETEGRREYAKATIKNKVALERELKRIDEQGVKEQEKIAKKQQKISLINSIIKTAEGVNNALATPPVWFGIAMASTIATLGAIQTGIIAKQAFERGGEVQKEQGVPATGDKHIIRVNPGEGVLTKDEYREYKMNRNKGNVINYGGNVYHINGDISPSTFMAMKKFERESVDYFVDTMRKANYRGLLNGVI